MKKQLYLIIFVLFLINNCGCNSSSSTQIATNTRETILITSTATIHPHTTRSMISETQTCTPELPTTTPSLTWTPISTLLPNDREEYLQTLFENNGDCNLPCWWGIMPGETTWEEARTTLLPLGILKTSGNDDYVRATFSIPVPLTLSDEISPGFPYFEPNLIIQDNLVEKITINSSWITDDFDHSLNGFLELLGTPTNIVIRSTLDVMEEAPYWNKPFYEMIVFFSF